MSRGWKIFIGVVLVLVIVIGLMGAAFRLGQGRINRALAQRDGVEQGNGQPISLEVRLIDDDEDGIPDRGVVEPPPGFGRGLRSPAGPEIEVTLVDDDEDGIPDRGVLELPARNDRGREFGPGRGRAFPPGRPGFAPGGPRGFGRGPGVGFNRGFWPFRIIGGLISLVLLAGIVVLAIFAFNRWRSRSKPTSTPAPVASPPPEPTEPVEAAGDEDEGTSNDKDGV